MKGYFVGTISAKKLEENRSSIDSTSYVYASTRTKQAQPRGVRLLCLERKILLETMDCYLNANYPNQLNGAMSVLSEMNFRYLAWHCFIDNTTSHPLSLRFPSPQNASWFPWRGGVADVGDHLDPACTCWPWVTQI